ncbi:MAG: class I SAM-dependent DNA methyltransferase, partial [Acidobacteriota bacterium]
MAHSTLEQSIFELLLNLRGPVILRQLFSLLNYRSVDKLLLSLTNKELNTALAQAPQLLATSGSGDGFQIIYTHLNSQYLDSKLERSIAMRLLCQHPFFLLIFSNQAQNHWHFLNIKYDTRVENRRYFRRITVMPGNGLAVAAGLLAMLDVNLLAQNPTCLTPLTIQLRHDEIF